MYPYPRMAERRWVNHIMREEVDGLAPLLERFPMYWHNPAGAWHREPDKAQWVDLTTGYPCLAVRGGSGSWCGYAGQRWADLQPFQATVISSLLFRPPPVYRDLAFVQRATALLAAQLTPALLGPAVGR